MRIIFIALALGHLCWARQTGQNSQKIWAQIAELKKLGYEKYQEKIVEISKNIGQYISYQKKICIGEFSALVFDDGKGEEGKQTLKKLSKREKDICFRLLADIEKAYIEASFDKRIEFSQMAHGKRMEALKKQKERALEELLSFKRKRAK